MEVCPVIMVDYAEAFGTSSANGYERLLLDAMIGDGTLFAHREGVEATWSLLTPLLEQWADWKPTGFPNYAAGTTISNGPTVIRNASVSSTSISRRRSARPRIRPRGSRA